MKFAEGSQVRLRGAELMSAMGADLSAVRDVLRSGAVSAVRRLFTTSEETLRAFTGQAAARSGRRQADLTLWYRLDLRPRQGYRSAASGSGIDADYVRTIPGGTGANVRVADIEYAWNFAHEDLSKLRAPGTFVRNGTPKDPFNDNNHGTAVAGILVGDVNDGGVTGLVPDSPIHVTNAANVERGWDVANSVIALARSLRPGDVLLIEQQTPGPAGCTGYVAPEWIPAIYDAIIEGAGSAPECGTARARLNFSTYGSRIDVQGWGNCVVTTGYGNLHSSGGANAYYTASFSGTSSAGPIVAAAAASLSSIAKQRGTTTLTPNQVRSILTSTGSPQVNPGTGNTGPLPNLRAAIAALPASGNQSPAATSTAGTPENVLDAWDRSAAM